MAKLIVNPTSSAKREIPLPRTLLSIGRDPSNDLVLPDAMVSRRHAVIECRGSQYFIRDCNSSNGSLVNGDRISERSLRDGDLVAIGTARLLYREEAVIEELGPKVVQHPSAPRVLQCPSCNADCRKGDLFCRQCGAPLAQSLPPKVVCTSCGTVVPLPAKFCNACGGTLVHEVERLESTRPRPIPEGIDAPPPSGDTPGSPRPDPDPEASPAEAHGSAPAAPRPEALPAVAPPAGPEPVPEAAAPVPDVSREASPAAEAPRAPRAASAEHALDRLPSGVPSPPSPNPWPPRPVLAGVRPREWERGEPRKPAVAERAGAGARLAAALLDLLLVTLMEGLVLSPAIYYWRFRAWPPSPSEPLFLPILVSTTLAVLAVGLSVAYYVYFWGVRGATLGQRFAGIAVEEANGKFPIGGSKAAVRLFGYVISGALLGIGFLMIAFGKDSLHDRLAGTRVVRRKG